MSLHLSSVVDIQTVTAFKNEPAAARTVGVAALI